MPIHSLTKGLKVGAQRIREEDRFSGTRIIFIVAAAFVLAALVTVALYNPDAGAQARQQTDSAISMQPTCKNELVFERLAARHYHEAARDPISDSASIEFAQSSNEAQLALLAWRDCDGQGIIPPGHKNGLDPHENGN